MRLSYTAIFYPWDKGEGFTVEIPDLPGCITEGDTMTEAIFMAGDAAARWLFAELERGGVVPKPSAAQTLKSKPGGFLNCIAFDMDAYAEKYGRKSVRKNVTIPAWLNDFAERYYINFSKTLQNVLIKAYDEVHKVDSKQGDFAFNHFVAQRILKELGIAPYSS